ncbi:consortin, connexin sorting protein b [Menidia menidia]
MGNKNTSTPKYTETEEMQKEGVFADGVTGGVYTDGAQGPSPELLVALESLGDNSDYTVLPHSLHQIAEACSLKEDYQAAIQFLQLEKLYHERLLFNLAVLQENLESQWREKRDILSSVSTETDDVTEKHIEMLSHICRTHLKPSISVGQKNINEGLSDNQKKETLQTSLDEVNSLEKTDGNEKREQSAKQNLESPLSSQHTDEEDGRKDTCEEVQEVEEVEEEGQCEETPEEELKVEWPTGVTQASDKDLAKLSHTEWNSSPDGLVSILKRRRASLDGLPPPNSSDVKQSSKRKVRFSEPEDGIEQDEVGGDSCLILLLLCLVTVVISIGGTALYCTVADTYSNICTDFTHNVDFYVTNVRGFIEGLGHWLPLRT